VKKAIVAIAIGAEYRAVVRNVTPMLRHYASTHHWHLHYVTQLPQEFRRNFSRPHWDDYRLLTNFKLYLPTMFANYDLLVLADPDLLVHPQAPCLSEYVEDIPKNGLAAVQPVTFEERILFPDWNRYYYDDFLSRDEVATIPFPKRHVNTGLLILKPEEIQTEFLELLRMNNDYFDEYRINLSFTQGERVFFLPRRWNVIYPYEMMRRGQEPLRTSQNWLARKVIYQFDIRIRQQRMIRDMFRDVWALHFACTDNNVLRNLDVRRLLSSQPRSTKGP